MKKPISLSLATSFVLSSMMAHAATITPELQRGEKNIYFTSPNGVQEVCVIPKHYPEGKYKKKDLKKELELCSYSFYPLSAQDAADGKQQALILPKLNSTNPGINIMKASDPTSKIGKYKNSTSCSYTPSILSYYHVSRILGGIGRVPPSVLRTMDIEVHKQIAAKALSQTKAPDLINSTWSSLNTVLKTGLASTKKDLLLSDKGDQSYGAFIMNPKHEEIYKELFTSASARPPEEMNVLRAQAFGDRNAVFASLKSSSPISAIATSEWTAANVQKLVAMRDASEFILLDHLLDQQDRFGNIAFQPRLAYIEKSLKSGDVSLEWAKDAEEIKEVTADGDMVMKTPVMVKSMILKDNDCGVSKSNVVKKVGLLTQVAHMNPKTYKRLIEFERSIEQNQTFFTRNLLFTGTDYAELVANVKDAAKILKTNCASGALKLDLDLEEYFTKGSVAAASCEVP